MMMPGGRCAVGRALLLAQLTLVAALPWWARDTGFVCAYGGCDNCASKELYCPEEDAGFMCSHGTCDDCTHKAPFCTDENGNGSYEVCWAGECGNCTRKAPFCDDATGGYMCYEGDCSACTDKAHFNDAFCAEDYSYCHSGTCSACDEVAFSTFCTQATTTFTATNTRTSTSSMTMTFTSSMTTTFTSSTGGGAFPWWVFLVGALLLVVGLAICGVTVAMRQSKEGGELKESLELS